MHRLKYSFSVIDDAGRWLVKQGESNSEKPRFVVGDQADSSHRFGACDRRFQFHYLSERVPCSGRRRRHFIQVYRSRGRTSYSTGLRGHARVHSLRCPHEFRKALNPACGIEPRTGHSPFLAPQSCPAFSLLADLPQPSLNYLSSNFGPRWARCIST